MKPFWKLLAPAMFQLRSGGVSDSCEADVNLSSWIFVLVRRFVSFPLIAIISSRQRGRKCSGRIAGLGAPTEFTAKTRPLPTREEIPHWLLDYQFRFKR